MLIEISYLFRQDLEQCNFMLQEILDKQESEFLEVLFTYIEGKGFVQGGFFMDYLRNYNRGYLAISYIALKITQILGNSILEQKITKRIKQ